MLVKVGLPINKCYACGLFIKDEQAVT